MLLLSCGSSLFILDANPLSHVYLQIFSPILWVAFHSVDYFFCFAEANGFLKNIYPSLIMWLSLILLDTCSISLKDDITIRLFLFPLLHIWVVSNFLLLPAILMSIFIYASSCTCVQLLYWTHSGGELLVCRHEHLHLYSCQIALQSGWNSSIFFHYCILFCQSGVKWYLIVVLNCIVLSLDILRVCSTQIFYSVNWLSTFFFSNSIVWVCLLVFKSSSCILQVNTWQVINIF